MIKKFKLPMQHPLKRPCNAPAALAVVRLLYLSLFAILSYLFTAHAAVPLEWTARPGQPAPVAFDRYHGETLDFRCTFQGFSPDGQTVFGQDADIRLYYQTNGMGTAWWSVPATVSSNVLSATWSPELDPGADRVSLFFGAPSNAYAAAVLRLRHSPGFTPAAPPPPAAFAESDPVFSEWLSTFTIPETSLDPATNYTDRALSSFAATGTVVRALSVGTPTRWTDATGCVWEVVLIRGGTPVSDTPGATWTGYEYWPSMELGKAYMTMNGVGWEQYTTLDEGWDNFTFTEEATRSDYEEGTLTENVTFTRPLVPVTNLVGRVALTNDIQRPPVTSVNSKTGAVQLSASDVSAYSAASGAALANTVDAWQSYWDGDEVRVTITNYFGSAGQPHLYIEQKVFDEAGGTNYYRTVWDEVTRQNILLARIVALETALAQKADRAWGFYDSHTGEFSPDGYTQVSSSNILLAAGMSYQKTITSGGEVWTLTATEPTQISGVGTNGFFRIEDGDGNALFEIVKGTRRTAAATSRAVSMAGGVFTIQYAVVADEHPVLQICSDLSLGDWADEGSTQRATVEWSGTSGNYTATVTPVGSQPKLFARATYEVGGNTYIKNNVASSLDRVVVKGTEYTVSVETVNGRKLMVLEVAP